MVSVNQPVAPGTDDMPNYFKYSSPISGVEADKSSGLALATIGTGIEGGAGLLESTAKKFISDDVRSKIEPIREDFTNDLMDAKNAQQAAASTVPKPVQTGAGPSTGSGNNILSSDTTGDRGTNPPPVAIDAGLSKVAAIQSSLTNGKVNDTYYDMRLKNAVTNLREKYPGFVDYIDQRVSAITGINPANALIQNLMQDINRSAVAKKTEYDHTVDAARGAMGTGLPNAKEHYDALIAAGPDGVGKFNEWYAAENGRMYSMKFQDEARKQARGSRDDTEAQRTSDLTTEINGSLLSNLNTVTKIAGIDTPGSIMQTVADAAAHPEQYTDTQMKSLDARLMAQKALVLQQYNARIMQTDKDSQGKPFSYSSDIGFQKAKDLVQAQVDSIYEPVHAALSAGGPSGAGVAFFHMNQATAILGGNKEAILLGPAGQFSATMNSIREMFGDQVLGAMVPDILKQQLDDKIRPLFTQNAMAARAQPDFDGSGQPVTLKQHMEEADKLTAQGKMNAAMKSRYYNSLVNISDDIRNPKMPDAEKANVVKYLFSPEGQGILNHIKTDYTDPQTGKLVPGKYSAFARLTSQDIVDNIAKLSKSDPSIGQMYKGYLEREAGAELFQKEFLNLNHFTDTNDLHFKYYDGAQGGSPHIEVIPPQDKGPIGRNYEKNDPGYVYQVQKVTNRINDALAGMSRVEKGLGGDVNSYALDFLQRSQVNLGKNWEGLSAKVLDAIAASKPRKVEDTFGAPK